MTPLARQYLCKWYILWCFMYIVRILPVTFPPLLSAYEKKYLSKLGKLNYKLNLPINYVQHGTLIMSSFQTRKSSIERFKIHVTWTSYH